MRHASGGRLLGALARGWRVPSSCVWIGVVALVVHWSPDLVVLPRMSVGSPVVSPVSSLAAWALALIALRSADEPCPIAFASSRGRVLDVNAARVVLMALVGLLVCFGVSDGYFLPAGCSLMLMLGEGLIAASLADLKFAWLPMTTHMVAAVALGAANRVDLAPWAWFISPDPSGEGLALAALIGATGLVLWRTQMRRRFRATP